MKKYEFCFYSILICNHYVSQASKAQWLLCATPAVIGLLKIPRSAHRDCVFIWTYLQRWIICI